MSLIWSRLLRSSGWVILKETLMCCTVNRTLPDRVIIPLATFTSQVVLPSSSCVPIWSSTKIHSDYRWFKAQVFTYHSTVVDDTQRHGSKSVERWDSMQPSVEDLHTNDSWMAVVINLVWVETFGKQRSVKPSSDFKQSLTSWLSQVCGIQRSRNQ
jgi:hypothetical protein